ncbi:MAG: hypothetical protein HUJ31_08925 [Pseudomonadales bacterium]|nr:hypothetical protein [Pseudomonadales bacterium]
MKSVGVSVTGEDWGDFGFGLAADVFGSLFVRAFEAFCFAGVFFALVLAVDFVFALDLVFAFDFFAVVFALAFLALAFLVAADFFFTAVFFVLVFALAFVLVLAFDLVFVLALLFALDFVLAFARLLVAGRFFALVATFFLALVFAFFAGDFLRFAAIVPSDARCKYKPVKIEQRTLPDHSTFAK